MISIVFPLDAKAFWGGVDKREVCARWGADDQTFIQTAKKLKLDVR